MKKFFECLGRDAEPILISLRDGYVPTTKKTELKVSKKANILDKSTTGKKSGTQAVISVSINPLQLYYTTIPTQAQ